MAGDHARPARASDAAAIAELIARREIVRRRLASVGEQPRAVPAEHVPGEDLGVERGVLTRKPPSMSLARPPAIRSATVSGCRERPVGPRIS